jgi:hypothetical protein
MTGSGCLESVAALRGVPHIGLVDQVTVGPGLLLRVELFLCQGAGVEELLEARFG